jgi:Spy/CpxP family protein refolding chaperone
MKNSGLLKFVLIASLILNVTLLATAGYVTYRQSAFWTSPFGGKMPRDRFLFDELALRPEQRKAMRAKAVAFRAEIDNRREEIAAGRKELVALLRRDAPDRKAIDAAIARISRMQENMQRRIAEHMLAEKALLDPDQRQKFMDLIGERMAAGGPPGCPPEQGQ